MKNNPKLSEKDVKHIAELAQLLLSSNEIKKFQKQLSEVIEYVEKLNELDTAKIEPTSQVTGLLNTWREDKILPSLSIREALKNAKNRKKNFIKTKALFK